MIHAEYNENYFLNEMRSRYVMTDLLRQEILSLAKGSRVLDLGCGDLHLLKTISELRPDLELHGVDVGEIPTKFLTTKITFIKSDFAAYDPACRFDLITAVDILEHLAVPQNLVKKSYDLLREGGGLYLNVPSVTKLFLFGRENFYSDYTHLRPFCAKGLVRMLVDHGLKVSRLETGEIRGFRHLPRFYYYVARGLLTMNTSYLNAAIRLIGGTGIEVKAARATTSKP